MNFNNSSPIRNSPPLPTSPAVLVPNSTVTNNEEAVELVAPVPLIGGNRFSVSPHTGAPENESTNRNNNSISLPSFAFSHDTENEFSGFDGQIISRDGDEFSQSPLTSHESTGTLTSSATSDSLVTNDSVSQFSQHSDQSTPPPDHLSDGTPPALELPMTGAAVVVEAPVPMNDNQRRIFFRNTFRHALTQAYQETDDTKMGTLSMKEVLTSTLHREDISDIAVHATLLTRLREFCDRIEEMLTGDPQNERSLHHAFSSAIETSYIEAVAAGASPAAAAQNAIKIAREYISPAHSTHQISLFNELIEPESSVHDWFSAVSDITPHIIRSELNQNISTASSSSSSSSTDRNRLLAQLHNTVLALFFDDVRKNFANAVGGMRPPSDLNQLCNDMAISTIRFTSGLQSTKINAAVRSIEEANDVLGRGFQEIALEVTHLPLTKASGIPLSNAELADKNIPEVIAEAFPIRPQQNIAIAGNDGPAIAEPIVEEHFEDFDELGELIPSRFADKEVNN